MKKHNINQKETEAHAARSSPQQVEKIFDSAEALLRFDAQQTPAPRAVGERLTQSVVNESRARKSNWWRRLLGG